MLLTARLHACRYALFGIVSGAVYLYLGIVLLARKVMRRRFAQRSWRLIRMVRLARPHNESEFHDASVVHSQRTVLPSCMHAAVQPLVRFRVMHQPWPQ